MNITKRTPRSAKPLTLEDARDDLPFQIHWELDDAPLSVWGFRVYAHLVRRAGRNGEIFPSYQSIGEACFRATYGPDANPRSLRNKAMAAMKELVEAGLVHKQERSRKGTRENDTNVYKLTPRRQWLDEMKSRRVALETATVQALETRRVESKSNAGGIVGMPPGTVGVPQGGTVGMPRGTVGVPKVSSTEVLQSFEVLSKEGVIQLEEDARARPPAAPPQVRTRQDAKAPSSSSKNASLQNRTAAQQSSKAVALMEPPAASPPAANAASEMLALTDQDFDELLRTGDVADQVPQKVVGGAVVGSPTAALQMASLVPVPRSVLTARPVAPVGSETYRGIKAMVGKHKLDELLSELTVTGGHSRQDWLRLLPDEIAQVREAARHEAMQHGGNMVTFAARGLDRMIGALANQKPQQQALQANGAAYIVREKPMVRAEEPSEGKYEVGALYRPKAGGVEVRLVGLETVKSKITGGGARYRLSDGQILGMLELISKFEFVGRELDSGQ